MAEIIKNKKKLNSFPENQRLVVMIAGSIYPRIGKIGYGLRSLGWRVVLLHNNMSFINDAGKCFDEIYRYNSPAEALTLAMGFEPVVYHVFTVWNFDIASLLIHSRIGRVILDNYDTLNGMIRTDFADKRYPGLLELERFCLENADGLCCRDIAIQYLRRNFNYKVKGKTIFFPDYCWDLQEDLNSSVDKSGNNDIHIVYAGGMNVEKLCRNDPYLSQFKNGFFLEFARDLANAGVYFHLYPPPNICAPDRFEDVFSEHIELSETTPFFQIHRPVPADKLISEISKYDLGLEATWYESHVIGSEASLPVRQYYSMSNKVFDYIDAGLGIILSDDLMMRRRMFERKGITITAYLDVVREKLLSLSAGLLSQLKDSVKIARRTYSVRSHAKRLSDFYLSFQAADTKKINFTTNEKKAYDFDSFTPKIFSIETSLACDLKCPECAIGGNMINRQKGFLKFDQFKIIADKIRPYARYAYLHIWGEPMLNRDIIPIIKYASAFTKTNISTNGMSLNENKAEELITSGVSDIIISIDGFTQEVYGEYRKGGDVQKALHSIKLLQYFNQLHGNKVNIIPQFIVFKHNQHEMTDFMNYCTSIGLRANFKAPYIRENSRFNNSDNMEFVRKPFHDIKALRLAMSSCRDPREVFTILMDGSVVMCCYDHNKHNSFGNIFDQDVEAIWNSPAYKNSRRDIISGNAPDSCVEDCLMYVLRKSGNDNPGISKAVTPIQQSARLKIYADRKYLLSGQWHVVLLNPFWGNSVEKHADGGRFDKYATLGQSYFSLTSLSESDIVLLPGVCPKWTPEYREMASQLAKKAENAGKPVVIFFNTDSDEEIDIDNGIIFRTSLYRSTRKLNQFAMPDWSIDFVEKYLNSTPPVRPKPFKPTVSFCGLVPPPPHVRYQVVNKLLRSRIIQPNFIIRDRFWGGALGDATKEEIVRKEYVENMVNGDYVLCMRGAGNFSFRLYETLSCGRIPVFVDTDCMLPYEDFIDWKRICVWVDHKDINFMDEIIMEFHNKLSAQDFIALQYECRKVWEEWLSPEGFFKNFHRHFGKSFSNKKEHVDNMTPILVSNLSGNQVTSNKESCGRDNDKPACVFINTYYPAFLNNSYNRFPQMHSLPYQRQRDLLEGEFFGDSNFYSSGLEIGGWRAEDLIINCPPLQDAWARENRFFGKGIEIAVEQIKRIRPQVLYIQDMNLISRDFIDTITPYTELVVGQIATPIVQQIPFDRYDLIFSSFPHYIERFRKAGLTAYYLPLAFEPKVFVSAYSYEQRPVACSFAGGISRLHQSSYKLLEMLARTIPIEFWGYGIETLPSDSVIHRRHHGEIWGKEMFNILSSSKITINRHGEVAENYANNMRLFEATGCGALLITDYKDNLDQLFEVGKEIVAYRSPEECASLIKYYLANPIEAGMIAEAGQRRTLSMHTYDKRMEKISEILRRHLRYRKEKNIYPAPDLSKISYGHTPIKPSDIPVELTSAWKNTEIPERQRALVQQELSGMYKGEIPLPYRVLAEILKPIISPRSSILEIGCSSGYYFEVLEYLLKMEIDYTGVDYSGAFIDMAKDYYPDASFFVSDGADLFFEDWQFHTVISSCILLHTPNFREHIFETARVAKNFVVAHRTPVCRNRPSQYLKKFAYGVETVELIFNEGEFLQEFSNNRLKLIKGIEFYKDHEKDEFTVTYLFKKM